jgi:hypothetical protein
MANTLGVYNPLFYANEALIQLENAMGMAGRVHRGFEAERNSFERGETINIRRPSTFTAQDAPSAAQDMNTGTVALTLDYWKEVKFKVTDKEQAFTGQRLIDDHIRPAAYALADDVDVKLAALYKTIPWYTALNASPGSVVTDITSPRKVLFDNKVPLGAGNVHMMVDGGLEAGLLSNPAFAQWQGAGTEGTNTQMRGALGTRYGLELFANQNVQAHTSGTASTDSVLVSGAATAGATTINLDAASLTGTVVPGDTFVIAGNTQRYAITNTVTAASNAMAAVTFTPALVANAADNAAVTLRTQTTDAENLAFHRNAFALAVAPLPEMARQLGAQVATVTDPVSGLSVRARVYYVGNSSEVHVALDILYGLTTLDPNLAVRVQQEA